MEHNNASQSNSNVILRKILADEVSMRPKFLYRLRFAFAIFLIVLITLISIFLFSFISFLIRTSEQGQLLQFGLSGVLSFVFLFPWFLLIVDIALIAFLEYLLRHFRFGYKQSVAFLLTALVLSIGIAGIVVDRETDLHGSLLESADNDTLPIFGGLYERAHAPLPHASGVCKCIVTSKHPLLVRDDGGSKESFPAVLPDLVVIEDLEKGTRLFMIGTFSQGVFYAQQVRVLTR